MPVIRITTENGKSKVKTQVEIPATMKDEFMRLRINEAMTYSVRGKDHIVLSYSNYKTREIKVL